MNVECGVIRLYSFGVRKLSLIVVIIFELGGESLVLLFSSNSKLWVQEDGRVDVVDLKCFWARRLSVIRELAFELEEESLVLLSSSNSTLWIQEDGRVDVVDLECFWARRLSVIRKLEFELGEESLVLLSSSNSTRGRPCGLSTINTSSLVSTSLISWSSLSKVGVV